MFDPARSLPPTRETAVLLAQQELGSPGVARIREYHDNAYGKPTGGKEQEWCGLFCLAMLHDAGIAKSVFWRNGGGFCEEQKLAKVKLPEPGDIAYYAAPYHHHAMVIGIDAEAGTFDTCDGNQLGDTVTIKRGIKLSKPTCFYSIDKLLPSGEP